MPGAYDAYFIYGVILGWRHRHISIPATQRMGLITEDAAEKAAALNSRQGWMGIFV